MFWGLCPDCQVLGQVPLQDRPGIEFPAQADADRIAGEDADFHQRDLHDTIEAGNHPTWTLYVQVMPFEDAKTYRFNPFDLTEVWPHRDYPLIKLRWADRAPPTMITSWARSRPPVAGSTPNR